ncbi:hypothetical protein HCA58_05065 [Micromonospora sp. HNM0581]|uniref:hypothetical protein n=1 Tax=Micromonospora sp. HNM0581 TaxID=2716341 RepID=UPI00146D5A5B|nr:hypothetical protein [Micromonospora sp. HNM0581]NLU77775.1 hypothetical protein [Micromonospora sp. HNM0581]
MAKELSYEMQRTIAALDTLTAGFRERLVAGEGLFPRETEEQERARLAYNRAAREHNARVLAERERAEREKQAAANRREIAAVRKRLCDSCFCELPASGVCGNC